MNDKYFFILIKTKIFNKLDRNKNKILRRCLKN